MLLEDARRMAQEDANQYDERVFIIYDLLSEDFDDLYSYCGERSMDIMYPERHRDFFRIIETIEPK